jgi:hypothetical protein
VLFILKSFPFLQFSHNPYYSYSFHSICFDAIVDKDGKNIPKRSVNLFDIIFLNQKEVNFCVALLISIYN